MEYARQVLIIKCRAPDLAFIGSNVSTISNTLTHSLQVCLLLHCLKHIDQLLLLAQAVWLVELLKGTHRLPSDEEMLQNIQEMRAWKQAAMVASSNRGAQLGLHQARAWLWLEV